jgi:hypothetical protein
MAYFFLFIYRTAHPLPSHEIRNKTQIFLDMMMNTLKVIYLSAENIHRAAGDWHA